MINLRARGVNSSIRGFEIERSSRDCLSSAGRKNSQMPCTKAFLSRSAVVDDIFPPFVPTQTSERARACMHVCVRATRERELHACKSRGNSERPPAPCSSFSTIPHVAGNILQTSLRAHATGSRSCVIKIADCVRIGDVFLPGRCCFSHPFSALSARGRFYACKFLRDSRGEIGVRESSRFIPR